jgi:hypothetical protein
MRRSLAAVQHGIAQAVGNPFHNVSLAAPIALAATLLRGCDGAAGNAAPIHRVEQAARAARDQAACCRTARTVTST